MLFVLAFLRKKLTNYVCTQIFGLYNLCIRVRATPLSCNILVYPFVFSVVLCYYHRGILISVVYLAWMITVHGLIMGASHKVFALSLCRACTYLMGVRNPNCLLGALLK